MTALSTFLHQAQRVMIRPEALPVEGTVADFLAQLSGNDAAIVHGIVPGEAYDIGIAVMHIERITAAYGQHAGGPVCIAHSPDTDRIDFIASDPAYLYFFVRGFVERNGDRDLASLLDPAVMRPAFRSLRPVYDSLLTQHNRTARGFDRTSHVRNLARIGCTHVEINGLAFPLPHETGPAGEVLHRFYTYCPALDQFTTSQLNDGAYPREYVNANMANLRTNADLARAYGLRSGLVCFEPRSVPDTLLKKHPMLRGARVDHPLRSFKPRYNLSIAHPVVLEHYTEMLTNIMRDVPDLDFLSIWSNDSGAGFEYTSSLYVGRNGGGYVIREWKDNEEIARAAAETILRFLRTLRDAGRTVNPRFRVMLRLEPFWAEYQHLWDGLEDGIGVEVSSLLTTGWGLRYQHPEIPEAPEIHGTALHNRFHADETPRIRELEEKSSFAEFYFSPEVLWNHEPVSGIPFPRLVHEKLKELYANGAASVCYYGSAIPPELCRWNINQEVVREFQSDPALDLDAFLLHHALLWVGQGEAETLRDIWLRCDDVLRAFPVPIWIYAAWSVWYRLWIRPIVPDIEAISAGDREYYERHLLATAHNRTRIDFRYDVGFELITPERADIFARMMDERMFPKLDATIGTLTDAFSRCSFDDTRRVYGDLRSRLVALRCLYRTQRNVSVWIAGVHGCLESRDETRKALCRRLLHDMVIDEIANTRQLHDLWSTTDRSWILVSGEEETTFIYDDHFGDHLLKKIELMSGREDDEPRVDAAFQWRVPGIAPPSMLQY